MTAWNACSWCGRLARNGSQAGGKIENGESAISALRREIHEEIGLCLENGVARPLGSFSAPAANEPGSVVEAEIYHFHLFHTPVVSAEIEEAIWVDPERAALMPLAPLTRDYILPLARIL